MCGLNNSMLKTGERILRNAKIDVDSAVSCRMSWWSMRWANIATILVGAVLVVGIVAYNYYDVEWMADVGSHNDMLLIGEGIYEYHAKTGKWPSKLDDLSG